MMLTFCGRLVDPSDIDPHHVELLDIAYALAHTMRWGGHACPRVSVAQHTLAGALYLDACVEPLEALAFLHHDDGEAFMGDMPRELKHAPEMAWFRDLEAALSDRLRLHFAPRTAFADMARVKEVDDMSLRVEWQGHMRPHGYARLVERDAPLRGEPMPAHYYADTEHETIAQWLRAHTTLTRKVTHDDTDK